MRVTVTDDEGVVLRQFKMQAATIEDALCEARDMNDVGVEEWGAEDDD